VTSPRSLGLSVVEDRLLPLAVVFGELRWRHAGKRAVRPVSVVVAPPSLGLLASINQVREQLSIEEFVSEPERGVGTT